MLGEKIKAPLRKARTFLHKNMKEAAYLKLTYLIYQHGFLNLECPKRFTEKLFYLKSYYRTQKDFIQEIYDKYTARDYVERKIGKQYLSKLLGVYDDAGEIDFGTLPDKFALKITQSCGYNLFCTGRGHLDEEETKRQMGKWLREVNSDKNREEDDCGYYFNGRAKIICEEYLEDSDGNIPLDIRLWCFNGKVKFYCMDFDTVDDEGNKKKFYYRNTYNAKGKLVPVNLGRPYNTKFEKPEFSNFGEMVKVAEKLAEDFVFVRVDLYNIDGRIVFGELTPIPQSGAGRITPKKYDYKFGTMLKLPEQELKETKLVRNGRWKN